MLEGVCCADGITSKSVGKEGRKERGAGREGGKEHTGECRVSRRKREGRARGGGEARTHIREEPTCLRVRVCVCVCVSCICVQVSAWWSSDTADTCHLGFSAVKLN